LTFVVAFSPNLDSGRAALTARSAVGDGTSAGWLPRRISRRTIPAYNGDIAARFNAEGIDNRLMVSR
jgi:hypothetical protein